MCKKTYQSMDQEIKSLPGGDMGTGILWIDENTMYWSSEIPKGKELDRLIGELILFKSDGSIVKLRDRQKG